MKADTKVWDWRGYILKYAPENATYKHLLLTLSCYMNSAGGSCFPSITELERSTSLSRPTIIKYLKKANDDGWIKTEKKKAINNVYDRNTYTADIPKKVVNQINHVVKEVNQGSKPDSNGVVKEVNSNSSSISSNNSSCARVNGANVPDVFVADEVEWIRKFVTYMKDNHRIIMSSMQTEIVMYDLGKFKAEGCSVIEIIKQSIVANHKKLYKPDDFGQKKKQHEQPRANSNAYKNYV